MVKQTVFYRHPIHGSGSYVTQYSSAAMAGEEALDMLPEDFAEDEDDGTEESMIRDDLQVWVYDGEHKTRPNRNPDYSTT